MLVEQRSQTHNVKVKFHHVSHFCRSDAPKKQPGRPRNYHPNYGPCVQPLKLLSTNLSQTSPQIWWFLTKRQWCSLAHARKSFGRSRSKWGAPCWQSWRKADMCLQICMYMYIYICIYIYIYMCDICICICDICISIYVYFHMNKMYIYIYVCVYMCICKKYVYIHI